MSVCTDHSVADFSTTASLCCAVQVIHRSASPHGAVRVVPQVRGRKWLENLSRKDSSDPCRGASTAAQLILQLISCSRMRDQRCKCGRGSTREAKIYGCLGLEPLCAPRRPTYQRPSVTRPSRRPPSLPPSRLQHFHAH